MNNLKDIHNLNPLYEVDLLSFYQDFNEQFEGYTQLGESRGVRKWRRFIRISMNNLKDIHNRGDMAVSKGKVVLSGFQWTIWRIYTTAIAYYIDMRKSFYQDFNEQFEGYTQPPLSSIVINFSRFIRISMNNLKDIHNLRVQLACWDLSFYQDFNEQFEGYTQPDICRIYFSTSRFIRISMNNLKDIHNCAYFFCVVLSVVLSGFQWTIWRIYTTLV